MWQVYCNVRPNPSIKRDALRRPLCQTLERMKNLYKAVIFTAYLALVFFVLPLVQNNMAIWFYVLAAVLFVASYSLLAGGSIKSSIFIVFIFSLALPIAMLIAIGMPVYHTAFSTFNQ